MGIRYLAISIDLDDYLRISAGPCPRCGARPHSREPDVASKVAAENRGIVYYIG